MSDAAPGGASTLVFPRQWPQALCRSTGLREHLWSTRYDILHEHSLWLLTLGYAHRAARRHRAPLVISPRGMMSGWAWRHRASRKRLASWLLHPGAIAGATGWHATSEEEAADIRALGLRQPICVAPNGVTIPSAADLVASRQHWLATCPKIQGRRVAVFYSRFHSKKRVRELVDLWLRAPREDWFLLLVGVPEEFSAAEINHWIASSGGVDRAQAFDGSTRPAPFGVTELFVLPSHSENFGLVVAEALAAGVPALVSEGTPWAGLAERGAGWQIAWEKWETELPTVLNTDSSELRRAGARGRDWMAESFTWSSAAKKLNDFYRSLLNV